MPVDIESSLQQYLLFMKWQRQHQLLNSSVSLFNMKSRLVLTIQSQWHISPRSMPNASYCSRRIWSWSARCRTLCLDMHSREIQITHRHVYSDLSNNLGSDLHEPNAGTFFIGQCYTVSTRLKKPYYISVSNPPFTNCIKIPHLNPFYKATSESYKSVHFYRY